MEIITSLTNDQIVKFAKLKQKKYRDEYNMFIVEDDHLIKEAIKNNLVYKTIGLDETCDIKATKEILDKLSSQDSGAKKIAIVKKIEEKEVSGDVLILDNIQDPGNLGTIIRSATAFGINTIILSDDSVDLYNEKVIRATEGMIFNINIIRRNLLSEIPKLKDMGYVIYSTDLGGNTSSFDGEKIALVMGNEGNGIKKEIANLCDKNILIDIDESCESLNVAIASSILMYEMKKRGK